MALDRGSQIAETNHAFPAFVSSRACGAARQIARHAPLFQKSRGKAKLDPWNPHDSFLNHYHPPLVMMHFGPYFQVSCEVCPWIAPRSKFKLRPKSPI